MTPIPNKFVSYEPCTIGQNIQIADGTLLELAQISSIHIELIGSLSTVVHDPKLFISLVLVQRIAKLDKFHIIFRILIPFSIIRSTGRGLDLLEYSEGNIIYLLHHPIVEGPLSPKQQW